MLKQAIITAVLSLPVLVTSPVVSGAASWTCRQADLTRQVTVFYPAAPASLPCRVFYTKPNENVLPRPLWQADHTEGYCERKAAEFVGRLTSWGWACSLDASGQSPDGDPEEPPSPNAR